MEIKSIWEMNVMLNFFKAARETAAAGAAQALSPRERLLLMEEIDRTR